MSWAVECWICFASTCEREAVSVLPTVSKKIVFLSFLHALSLRFRVVPHKCKMTGKFRCCISHPKDAISSRVSSELKHWFCLRAKRILWENFRHQLITTRLQDFAGRSVKFMLVIMDLEWIMWRMQFSSPSKRVRNGVLYFIGSGTSMFLFHTASSLPHP